VFTALFDLRLVGALVPASRVEAPTPAVVSDTFVEALADWWQREVLTPFLATPPNQRRDLVVSLAHSGGVTRVTVRFDANHMLDVYRVYGGFGWAGVEAIGAVLEELPDLLTGAARRFHQATRNVVAVTVAQALIELEASAGDLARSSWTTLRKQTDAALSRFRRFGNTVDAWGLSDRTMAAALLTACRAYAVDAQSVLTLEPTVRQLGGAEPPWRRKKGSGFEMWYELFARPQREVQTRMAATLARIHRIFPYAALVLSDRGLVKALAEAGSANQKQVALRSLEQAVRARLAGIQADTDALLDSLGKPGATAFLAEIVAPVRDRREFGRLFRLAVPAGGYEAQLVQQVTREPDDRAGRARGPVPTPDQQRLLAMVQLVAQLRDDEMRVPAGTWNRVVARNYLNRLGAWRDAEEGAEATVTGILAVAYRVAAALSLFALLAVFPFGEAAAPGLVAALVALGYAAAGLTLTLYLVDAVRALDQAGQLTREAQDQLFRLGQDDPEAVALVGRLLSESIAMRTAVLTGAIGVLLTLAAASALRPVAVALDAYGAIDDVETLFGP
jgi:hypothetical protein